MVLGPRVISVLENDSLGWVSPASPNSVLSFSDFRESEEEILNLHGPFRLAGHGSWPAGCTFSEHRVGARREEINNKQQL